MRIGLAVILLAAALAARGDALDVRTSQVDDLTGASRVVTNVTFDAEGAFNAISNRADALIKAVAPAPGDYGTVSNRAMSALQSHQSLRPSTNYTDAALGAFASTGAVARATVYGTPTRWTDATGCVWEVVANVWFDHRDGNIFVNGVSIFPSDITEGDMKGYLYYDPSAMEFVGETGGGWYHNGANTSGTPGVLAGGPDATSLDGDNLTLGSLTNLVGRVALTNDIPDVSGYATQQQATNAATAVADTKISTNNAAFVSAVLAVPLTGADAGDLAEIAEYGGYGTVGAALLALIAGLAALKRRVTSAETALAGKMPTYPMVAVTPSSGTLTVAPYTVATYTAQSSAVAFTVAVGVGETGKGRDCELVIDCTATGAVAPTVTWPSNFHPRTDAATDFACETGVRNVYFISEYAAGEFAVGGWQETAGGNA